MRSLSLLTLVLALAGCGRPGEEECKKAIENINKSYELTPCDLARVARDTYEQYRFQLDEKGFTHRFEAAPGIPEASADEFAVAQAVINLLENAIKYSGDRKEIEVRVTGEDGAVRVSVADRGIGIAREDQPRIWEDFYRTREARALGTRGSGLGLSVVLHILKAHGGRVALESAPGEGSTFTLVFPLPQGQAKPESEAGDR